MISLKTKGIIHQTLSANTPKKTNIVGRKDGHLLYVTRALMSIRFLVTKNINK